MATSKGKRDAVIFSKFRNINNSVSRSSWRIKPSKYASLPIAELALPELKDVNGLEFPPIFA